MVHKPKEKWFIQHSTGWGLETEVGHEELGEGERGKGRKGLPQADLRWLSWAPFAHLPPLFRSLWSPPWRPGVKGIRSGSIGLRIALCTGAHPGDLCSRRKAGPRYPKCLLGEAGWTHKGVAARTARTKDGAEPVAGELACR